MSLPLYNTGKGEDHMLGENIKILRKQKGYTQDELACRLHVVRQTVSKWEKGISVPDADTLSRMADIFEVDVNELLGTVVMPEEKEDAIARELAKLNDYLAIRNRRIKTFWRILTVIGILIMICGILGIGFGVINYNAAANSAAYNSEIVHNVLPRYISAFQQGVVRTIIGLLITVASFLMNRNQ